MTDVMNAKREAAILFSGGSDSTLVAALMCRQYEKVHLLTFFNAGLPFYERSNINAQRLSDRFGNDRIVHRLIDFETLFKRLYYDRYLHDLKKYGTYMVPCFCNACQMAMHIRTIQYCGSNHIRSAYDGYKREKEHIYGFMAEEGICETKKLYEEYGIDYSNPVYDIVRTDWELYNMGITPKKDVKFPYERLNYSTQHHCRTGIIVNAYLMGYFLPRHGQERSQKISIAYWKDKIEVAKKLIGSVYYTDNNRKRRGDTTALCI